MNVMKKKKRKKKIKRKRKKNEGDEEKGNKEKKKKKNTKEKKRRKRRSVQNNILSCPLFAPVNEKVDSDQSGLNVFIRVIIKGGKTGSDGFERIVKIDDDLVERKSVFVHHSIT